MKIEDLVTRRLPFAGLETEEVALWSKTKSSQLFPVSQKPTPFLYHISLAKLIP
jgi:hypothetical protein